MKPIYIITLICLLCAADIQAAPLKTQDQESDTLSILLSEYQKKGYQITGPVQYINKSHRQVFFYLHVPVSFKKLTIITPEGKTSFLKKYDFVYVLSKKQTIVLIHLTGRETDNA